MAPLSLFARLYSQPSQPEDGTSHLNEGQEGPSECVVTGDDASELLDPCEATFDQMTALVEMPIERVRIEAIGTRRNHCLAALPGNGGHEGIRAIVLVGHNEFGRLILDNVAACLISEIWPADRMMRSGLPRTSAATCGLVVSPPHERPMSGAHGRWPLEVLPPRTAGTHDPKNDFDEVPVILGRTARITLLPWQYLFNACLPVISSHCPIHPDARAKVGI